MTKGNVAALENYRFRLYLVTDGEEVGIVQARESLTIGIFSRFGLTPLIATQQELERLVAMGAHVTDIEV